MCESLYEQQKFVYLNNVVNKKSTTKQIYTLLSCQTMISL